MEENFNNEEELDDLIKMLESMNDEEIDFDSVMDILGINGEELEEEYLKQSPKLEVKFKNLNPMR